MSQTNMAQIRNQATVIALEGTMARVEVARSSMCDGCHQQSTCKVTMPDAGRDTAATVHNPVGARVGDEVEIAIDETVLLRGGVMLYLLPLAFMVIGIVLAMALRERVSFGLSDDMLALLAALAGLAVSLPVVRAWSKRSRYLAANVPVITRVLRQDEQSRCGIAEMHLK